MKKMYVFAALLGLIPATGWAGEDMRGEAVPSMEEVVVTATKTVEKRKDIPNAIIVKDSVEIAESAAQSVGEVLANEPGIDLRTRGNYGGASDEIHIRGMGADGAQVMVNGVVLNSPSFGSADVSQIPLNSIDRVETVKGPGSVLYGSGAMGGTVSVITKRPERETMTALAEAGFGTEASWKLAAEQGMFLTGDLGYYLTASYEETDGFRDNSDLDHSDVSLNLVYDREDLDISLYSDYLDREYGVPGPATPEGTMDYYIGSTRMYNSESSSLVNRGGDENFHSALEAKSKVSDMLELRFKADYSALETYNLTRYAWSGSGEETTVANTVKGIEINANVSPLSWLKGIAGTEYRDFNYENEQQGIDWTGAQIAGFVSTNEHGVYTQGTFAELQVTPVDMVKLVAGFRYEDHSRFGDETVPRFGLVVNPVAGTTLKVNHGKHFKAPAMNDLFWPDDGFAKGNTGLKPETGWHSDVTVEQSLMAGKGLVSLSYFNWDLTDKIDWAENPGEPTMIPGWNYWTPSNISKYNGNGVEIGAGFKPVENIRADIGFTYQDVEEELVPGVTRQARYKPETLFKCSLTHRADFGLVSSVTARYTGERPGYYRLQTDEEPLEVLDSYWTVDVKLTQELLENWRVTLLATNLLDEEYDTYLAGFTDQATWVTSQQPYPGAGRSLFASVSYEF